MDTPRTVVTIDEYSLATCPIEMRFNGTLLSNGTAFVWELDGKLFLITNWHNVSGRNPNTDKHLSPTAAEPNLLRIRFNNPTNFGHNTGEVELRTADGGAIWLVHPIQKRKVDVVAIPLLGQLPTDVIRPINKMSSLDRLLVGIGMDVFIIGYPFAVEDVGLPVWKRGSIASEPGLSPAATPYLLVDTASRPGMSGSPVVMRSWGTHTLIPDRSTGAVAETQVTVGAATKFIGVYSGRLHTKDPLDAQLGMVWPSVFIEEIIKGGSKEYG